MTRLPLYSHRKSRRHPEAGLQGAVCDLLRLYGVPNLIWFHPVNEGRRAPRTGAFLKRQGMLSGVADLSITSPGGRQCFLELKADKGKLSPAQIAFQSLCARNGTDYAVCRTLDEAASVLTRWQALATNPLARPVARKAA